VEEVDVEQIVFSSSGRVVAIEHAVPELHQFDNKANKLQ
jgi:hypothetical protein